MTPIENTNVFLTYTNLINGENNMDKRLTELLTTSYWMPDLCPKCGGDVHVYRNPQNKNALGIERVRECLDCGHKYQTIEILTEPLHAA